MQLQKFVEAANKNDNSRIVTVPTGMRAADVVRQSVLVRNNVGGSGVAGTAGSSGGAFEEYGGVDPSLDPELAMALRVSMAEAHEQAESQGAAAPASGLVEGKGVGGEELDRISI